MELERVLRHRRMVRAFDGRPVCPAVLDRVLAAALAGPSAGFSQGLDLVVLTGPEETARYWDASFGDVEARGRFRWQGLLAAPVVVVVVVAPGAYAARYAEADKASSVGPDRWPVPYWWVDAGMAVMLALLAAVDEGLGAAFFGTFDQTDAVRRALRIPEDRGVVGTLALGHPAPDDPARSARRPRRPLDEVVHRGGW